MRRTLQIFLVLVCQCHTESYPLYVVSFHFRFGLGIIKSSNSKPVTLSKRIWPRSSLAKIKQRHWLRLDRGLFSIRCESFGARLVVKRSTGTQILSRQMKFEQPNGVTRGLRIPIVKSSRRDVRCGKRILCCQRIRSIQSFID